MTPPVGLLIAPSTTSRTPSRMEHNIVGEFSRESASEVERARGSRESWYMMCGCWRARALWLCACVSVSRLSDAKKKNTENLLHHHLQPAVRRSKLGSTLPCTPLHSTPRAADAAPPRWDDDDDDDDALESRRAGEESPPRVGPTTCNQAAVAAAAAASIQPSNQTDDQARPTDQRPRRPTMFPDARRCEAIVYRQFSCRAEVNADQKRAKGKLCSAGQRRESSVPFRIRGVRIAAVSVCTRTSCGLLFLPPKADFCDSRLATLFGFPAFFLASFSAAVGDSYRDRDELSWAKDSSRQNSPQKTAMRVNGK